MQACWPCDFDTRSTVSVSLSVDVDQPPSQSKSWRDAEYRRLAYAAAELDGLVHTISVLYHDEVGLPSRSHFLVDIPARRNGNETTLHDTVSLKTGSSIDMSCLMKKARPHLASGLRHAGSFSHVTKLTVSLMRTLVSSTACTQAPNQPASRVARQPAMPVPKKNRGKRTRKNA